MLRSFLLVLLCILVGKAGAAFNSVDFNFYGRTVPVVISPEIQSFRFDNRSVCFSKISAQLKSMDADGLCTTFDGLRFEARQMKLDRLGYFQLLKVFSMKIFPHQSPAFRIALVWYGLRHRGIDAILAGKNDYLNLFVRMEHETDGGYSMTHLGKKYYSATYGAIPYDALEVFRLPLLQDSAYEEITMNLNRLPELGTDIEYRNREFEYDSRNYILTTRYNADLVAYMNDLPHFRIGPYLYQVRPSDDAYHSLDDSLQVWMKNMNYGEKMSFLLTLVQKAFPYKADRDYRATEKRNFVEQTLADDYTDCEDKAAFFCFLAGEYLNSKTVLIYSSKNIHVNCAIQLSPGAPGYTFKYKDHPYLICEPSFMGYKPGETTMSQKDIRESEIFE